MPETSADITVEFQRACTIAIRSPEPVMKGQWCENVYFAFLYLPSSFGASPGPFSAVDAIAGCDGDGVSNAVLLLEF